MASFATMPRVARVGLAVCTLALTVVDVPYVQRLELENKGAEGERIAAGLLSFGRRQQNGEVGHTGSD
mgnify:CR=1 FL=1